MTRPERWRILSPPSVLALLTFILLLGIDIARTESPLPERLEFNLTLPPATIGRTEPLVVTGWTESATFLLVSYVGENKAVFLYQAGEYGVVSPEVTYAPGQSYPIVLEMPAVAHASRPRPPVTSQLMLAIANHVILQQVAPFFPASSRRIFFGENPVGGTTNGLAFRGTLTLDGRLLNQRSHPATSLAQRTKGWLRQKAWRFLPFAILAAAVAVTFQRFPLVQLWLRRVLDALRSHRWFFVAAAASVTVFTWLMTGGNFRLLYPDAGAAIYDFQARSFLQGRLDIPPGSAGGEEFIVDGKSYIYFGPTPSVLRLPFVAFNIGFGHLTRPLMLAQYVACLAAAYLLLLHASRQRGGPSARPSGWATLLMVFSTGSGGTLLFLASRAYIYHEAILCGAAFALWTACFSLRYAETGRTRDAALALLCAVFSLHARAPIGVFAIGIIGLAALHQFRGNGSVPGKRMRPAMVAVAALLGFISLNVVAYLKFKTPNGSPMHLNVQYSKERLAKIDGRMFHLANLPHNLNAYVTSPGIKLGGQFPFATFELQRREFPKAKIDLEEPTAGIPYAMTGLMLLALFAGNSVRHVPAFRLPLAIIAVGSIPLLGCMLTFIATSHRYSADFAPPLIAMAAFGLAFLNQVLRPWRRLGLALVSAATVQACLITLALSFHFQLEIVWGTPEEVRLNLLHLRDRTNR